MTSRIRWCGVVVDWRVQTDTASDVIGHIQSMAFAADGTVWIWGVWSELNNPSLPIDTYRRNLQCSYLETTDERLNGTAASSAEVRSLVAGAFAQSRS